MIAYDLLMLVVLVAAMVFGAWKGLAWQLASLGAIFVSYLVAYELRNPAGALIPAESPWNVFLAMLIVYLLTSLAIWIGFRFFAALLDRLKLKEFDRQIGAMLGLAKGALLCTIITLFAVMLAGESQRQSIVGSYSGYYIAKMLDKAHAVMPDEVHDVLHPYIHSLDGRLDHAHDHSAGR